MTEHPVLHVLQRTLDVLERHGIDFALMGGFAVGYWGLPRPTYDVDLAIGVGAEDLSRLLRGFEDAGYTVDVPHERGFADTIAGMQKVGVGLYDQGTVWRVDLFLATTPLVGSALDRRVSVEIEGRRVPVITVEDLLLFKLLANRAKDQSDVEDLLLVCRGLDAAYLREWSARLGIEERLERALRSRA